MTYSNSLLRFVLLSFVFIFSYCSNVKKDNSESEIGLIQYNSTQLIEDMNYIFETLEKKHPNPYLYTKKEIIDQMRKQAEVDIITKSPMDYMKFWGIVSPIVNELKDQHTCLGLISDNEKVINIKIYQRLLFEYTNHIAYVKECLKSDSFLLKNQILSINGIDPNAILTNLIKHWWKFANTYSDEYNSNDIYVLPYGGNAQQLYALYGFKDFLNIEYKDKKGIVHTKQVKLYTSQEIIKIPYTEMIGFEFSNKLAYLDNYQYKIFEDICWLRINVFDLKLLNSPQLVQVFKDIKEKSIKNLIIDIRGNSGGNDAVWNLLLGYLYTGPYKIIYSNKPLTAKQWYSNFLKSIFKNNSFDYQWDNYFYNGKVYVLINKTVMSSAVHFVDVLKFYNIAKIIGSKTAFFASHFGELKEFMLPNTKTWIGYSSKYFISVTGDESPHGVIPDIDTSGWKNNQNIVYPEYSIQISTYEKYILEIIKTNKSF